MALTRSSWGSTATPIGLSFSAIPTSRRVSIPKEVLDFLQAGKVDVQRLFAKALAELDLDQLIAVIDGCADNRAGAIDAVLHPVADGKLRHGRRFFRIFRCVAGGEASGLAGTVG